MNIAAPTVAPTPDRTSIVPPASAVTSTYGAHFTALGAKTVEATDAFNVRVGFNEVLPATIAANLLADTVFGAKLAIDMPLTGIPYNVGSADIVAALSLLPGVATVVDHMAVDRPLISVMAGSAQDAATLKPLLRDSVQLHGRGGMQDVRIEVLTDTPVVPFG